MNKQAIVMAMALSLLIPYGINAYADEDTNKSPKQTKEVASELTNDYLDQQSKQVDGMFAYRSDEIAKQTRDAQAIHGQERDERVAFEKRMADEQKAFLSYLKTARIDERDKMLKDFEIKQKKNRADFAREEQLKCKTDDDKIYKDQSDLSATLFNDYRDEAQYAQSWQPPVVAVAQAPAPKKHAMHVKKKHHTTTEN